MSYYNSRIDFELARTLSFEKELQRSRNLHALQTSEYRRLKELEHLRSEQQFQEFKARRQLEEREANTAMLRERILREERYRENEALMNEETVARMRRETEMDAQRRLYEEQQRQRAQANAIARQTELEQRQRAMDDKQKENNSIIACQKRQQTLEQELKAIDVEIGSIYDSREQRKKEELVQLEQLDQKSFQLRQAMRGNKVRQQELQDSISRLSQIMTR